jgi:hypothetical protein
LSNLKGIFTALLVALLAFGRAGGAAASPDSKPLLIVDPKRAARLPGAAAGTETDTVTVGSLRVVAPKQTLSPASFPRRRYGWEGLWREQRLTCLLTLLTQDQWRKLGQAPGLDAADLSGESHALFLLLLPDPFLIQVPGAEPGVEKWEKRTLREPDRQNVRLRFQLGVSRLGARRSVYEYPYRQWDFPGMPALGTAGTGLFDPAPIQETGLPLVRTTVPNRRKLSDIDYREAALRKSVPLDGAKTVGDLVTRIAAATGKELYADSRFGALPVTAVAGTAQGGDLMRALALAVCGRSYWRRNSIRKRG